MCRILGLSRQSYYYQSKPKKDESPDEEVVAEDFIRRLIQLIHQVTPEHPLIHQEITLTEGRQTLDLSLRYFTNSEGTGQILGVYLQ
ncbi:hypothetical protein EfmAA610_19930 [Enterococcus faecium]|nr:hypothetical protein EfmAA610_19930 [Enterococcus faecium]